MAGTRPALDEAERLAIAVLCARGVSQTAIARRIGVEQSTVSRVLKSAGKEGLLLRTVTVNPQKFDKAVFARALQLIEPETELQQRLAGLADTRAIPHGVTVRVFPHPVLRERKPNYDLRTESFAAGVARHVWDLLRGGARTCGLTWGVSIGGVVRGIEELAQGLPRVARAVRIVPLCGDPLGRDASSLVSSTALAQRLSVVANPRSEPSLSLAMLPAFLPGDFSADEVNTVWKLIGKMHAYQAIFGGRHARAESAGGSGGFADGLDMIVTGISVAGRPLGDGHGPLFASGGLTEATFRDLVLADIGGVLIERDSLKPGQRALLSRLKLRWTGLNARELRECARRGGADPDDTRRPGVVLVAAGKPKAASVHAAIRRGLVNHLLIDAELEGDLLKLFKA